MEVRLIDKSKKLRWKRVSDYICINIDLIVNWNKIISTIITMVYY